MYYRNWNGPAFYELRDGRSAWVDRYRDGDARYGGEWLGVWFDGRPVGRPEIAARGDAVDAFLARRTRPSALAVRPIALRPPA